MEDLKSLDTLFLERDGVINVHFEGDYVKSISELIFIKSALEGLKILTTLFKRIIIVTNQRGVGKGIMTHRDLTEINTKMIQTIEYHGGRIDRIYTCTDLDDNSPNRKPNMGMISQAMRDFPDIKLSDSWLVGDDSSDMQLAANAGIKGILVGGRYTPEAINPTPVHAHYKDLFTFAKKLRKSYQDENSDHLLSTLQD